MFSKLPDLFDRNFAIGYFLPVTVFLVANIAFLNTLGLLPNILSLNTSNEVDTLIGATMLGLISWIGGIFLVATNRDIIRLMEGYGSFNPLRLFSFIEQWRYKQIKRRISKLDKKYIEYNNMKMEFPIHLRNTRNHLMQRMVERFPDNERWLLPTSFGNTIRAFEVYPRVMYGADSIATWDRLRAIIPEEYQKIINDAKALLDFWINLCFLSVAFLVEYASISMYYSKLATVFSLLIAVIVVITTFIRARYSASEWGELIKSSFDVYLTELYEKLGFSDKLTDSERRQVWSRFSQAVIYVDPDLMPERGIASTEKKD